MAFGTRVGTILVALSGTVLLSACGGSDDSKMRATLTDEGCAYRGDTTVAAGRFTIEVENQTEDSGSFALEELAEGFTAENIKPILEKYAAWWRSLTEADIRNLRQGKPPLHPPPELPEISKDGVEIIAEVDGGGSTALPADMPAGSYALICRTEDIGVQRFSVATQIEVTGTPS